MNSSNVDPRNSIHRSPVWPVLLLVAVVLVCFALSPALHAVTPAPDGAYPGGNTAEGQNALQSLTSGTNNTALGFQALYHNTTGSNNAATGFRALYSDITGVNNTATGSQALSSNTTGNQNTANGYVALSSNTSGGSNTATGSGALRSNTSANHNTATGYIALYRNTTGGYNTATGDRALYSNTTGAQNTANGYQALNNNTTGIGNAANGYQSLYSNTTGNYNTANGYQALQVNLAGGNNTAIGFGALGTILGSNNTGIGAATLLFTSMGSGNIAVGYFSGNGLDAGDNNIYIGSASGGSSESNTIHIGENHTVTYIAGIYGATASGGAAVYVNSAGQLGTSTSSRRFKDQIKPMEKASEALFGLNPVTFRYKNEIDPGGIPQFGLVAEEVEKVNPDLVVRDPDGKPYTVRYEAVNAMLLNEFLKEHRTVQELKSTVAKQEAIIAQQQKGMESVIARLKEQDSKIQKVNDQLQLSKAAPQVVLNNQ
jgi:hypothetical protein